MAILYRKQELQELIKRERIDLCAISMIVPFTLCNSSMYRQDRLDSGGGGAAILVRRNISLPAPQSIEVIGVSLHLTTQWSMTVIAAYKPPLGHLLLWILMPFLVIIPLLWYVGVLTVASCMEEPCR
ncbi:hypothetical protein Zmor_028533 [Zophobas morio]|jgi:hypothetical protein|uniref:Uncharacterized protein n=1 Tax=Zophobas morio TaxID=2755281 RepID=A0AA38HJP7_9CUCU|nr:hypothetical protein Zmor_028533 [Zophobas morio]